MRRLSSWFWIALSVGVLAASGASAQERKARTPKGKRAEVSVEGKGEAASEGAGKGDGASDAAESDGESKKDAPRGLAADAPDSADGGEIRKEGDTEVKVMEFTGLDIEGQLKTPQMLYFLNRLRAEFGRPRLPHRSFMPELQDSAHSKALK